MSESGAIAIAPTESRIDRTGQPVIRAQGVWKVFGPKGERLVGSPDALLPRGELREKTGCVVAVRDVSIEVWPGEVFVVMGLSGSGKSTLVRTLVRLIEPTAGSIEIAGRDVVAAGKAELRSSAGTRSRWCFSTSGSSRTGGCSTTSRSGSRCRGWRRRSGTRGHARC